MKVTVLGLGYVGLPTAALLAESGHEVAGYDVDEQVVRSIVEGSQHMGELDVRALAENAVRNGRLHASTFIHPADAFIICVPTPTIDRRPDLSAVERAFSEIAPICQDGNLVVLESTVPPRTTEQIARRVFAEFERDLDTIHLAHCPERVLPGQTIAELQWNDRIIGGRRPVDASAARGLYATFARGTIHETDLITAETVKVVENAFRDVNIAFANEFAVLSEDLGIDAWEAIRLANCHPRVNILSPGPGVGGHCIPIDPQFLSDVNPFATELIQTARRVNERMPHRIAKRVCELFPGTTIARKVVLLGAAYKAGVDDARETPARAIELLLLERGFHVTVYDPKVTCYEGNLVRDLTDALRGADALVLVTDHEEICQIQPAEVAGLVRSRHLIDTRNALDAAAWIGEGFEVSVLGRGRLPAGELHVLA
jgi:UDP-N-acetyl-D-mannosaminuronic acid dehydrogenase